MTLRLNANKTKLYNLAKAYFPEIEPRKNTQFVKYNRVREYALDFWVGNYYHHLTLIICGGKALLGDAWTSYEDDGTKTKYWEYNTLSLDELRKFDLLEEVPNK